MMTLKQLKKKDVIRLSTGDNLGRADDLQLDEARADITAIVLYGRPKWFGLGGRQPDLVIPWNGITKIGNDVIMVELPEPSAAETK